CAPRCGGVQTPRDCVPAGHFRRHIQGAVASRADDAAPPSRTGGRCGMKSDAFTDRLSEYLDDELSTAERASVDTHLAECDACRATLAELRRVVARGAKLSAPAPENDLWAAIESRISGSVTTARVSPFRRAI